ncbi:TPA: DUF1177 domain-containing protein [Candidatus Bipolaricaulota bacterium]|nr:DUF1177 domain-containing protein [Candidatus Bipolaricaulota bacterium]HIP99312.1 DUF1177 domain-containing protein [Candidatus Bipolaricaulota bacterium]
MLRQVLEALELLEDPRVDGAMVQGWLAGKGTAALQVTRLEGEGGHTDALTIWVKGVGGGATLGIIGQLGGVGARPQRLGLVSDADGAIVALACAAKLLEMRRKGDRLPGDVVITTHICPQAPLLPHAPVPFMGSPVGLPTLLRELVAPEMEAILSVDTTKGNWVLNRIGFAITPTVKEGYILRVSEDLLAIMRHVTNGPPQVLPITTQDITPYGNGLYHINSIMQPATVTAAPVVGVATTSAVPVPGPATGANQPFALERAARFCLEVAVAFTRGECRFYDPEEFARLLALYGSMRHLQAPD